MLYKIENNEIDNALMVNKVKFGMTIDHLWMILYNFKKHKHSIAIGFHSFLYLSNVNIPKMFNLSLTFNAITLTRFYLSKNRIFYFSSHSLPQALFLLTKLYYF